MSKNEEGIQKQEQISAGKAKVNFPIVGIGASAGGLDAIRKLLEHLPENLGMAYVVVQHLATGQESMLPEILSRSTRMPVNKVTNGMPINPDNVYVIPSGKNMTVHEGVLRLTPRGLSLKPIDDFLHSLAVELKTQAIGIILSGTGTDGTEGLKFVKAEGGITFAQDSKSAQYADMPKSAIAEDVVYFVLPPEKMAEELSRIAKHPEIIRQKIETEAVVQPEQESDTETIFSLLKNAFGVNFLDYKRTTTSRRIARRMVLNKIENSSEYVEYLRTHRSELQALFDDLLIGVTGFFREPNTFELLREKVFPDIADKALHNQPIRIWVPGCSTGEEVYSIGIALQEFLEDKHIVDRQIQIFGTDIHEKNVERARKGVYPKTIESSISENILRRFFVTANGNYQVSKNIRDMCVFAKHDVTRDPPFSNLDMIVCRNLLIYFDTKLQERVLPLFHYGLKPNGYLILGEAESVGKLTNLFEPFTRKGIIFKKKTTQPIFQLQLETPITYTIKKQIRRPGRAESIAMLEGEVDHLLMNDYVPAALLLNSELDIIVFRGKIDPYISIEPGTASLNATKIIKKELRPILQTAVYRAKKGKKEVKEIARVEEGKVRRIINIDVKAVKLPNYDEPFFLAFFSEVKDKPVAPESTANTAETVDAKDQQIKELSEELNAHKQTLQTIIEQQEATNEELRSAMEEVQSSNEELMSTNEELETAKEELQSTNEELTTLNEELKNRNTNLSTVNDDLANLMGNVDTAVVIVDNSFKIRRFTNSAQELLRLLPSDIDHLITDIRLGIPTEGLDEALRKVINNLETVRQEIHTEKGKWYQLRIRPYLTIDKKISGAVISFAEITELKNMEAALKNQSETLEHRVGEQSRKLLQSERLAVIGRTAGMVGHDIRNPLQAILGEVFTVKSKINGLATEDTKAGIKKSMASIEDQIFYINKIISDLQDYSKTTPPMMEEVDTAKVIQNSIEMITMPKNVTTSISIDKNLPKLYVDEAYLKRILTNMFSNAIQAMPEGGNLSVNASCQNGKAFIGVSDTGEGIPDEAKDKIFTPLFTTKSKGQGFGTAVIKKLTEAMGGNVSFVSEKGKGTTFTLEFSISK